MAPVRAGAKRAGGLARINATTRDGEGKQEFGPPEGDALSRGLRVSAVATTRSDPYATEPSAFPAPAPQRRGVVGFLPRLTRGRATPCAAFRRRAGGAIRAAAGGLRRAADGLLPPEQAAQGPGLEALLKQPCCPALTLKMQAQITKALPPASEALARALPEQRRLGIDESPTKDAGAKSWLGTVVAGLLTVGSGPSPRSHRPTSAARPTA
jgi:hypothetical protein